MSVNIPYIYMYEIGEMDTQKVLYFTSLCIAGILIMNMDYGLLQNALEVQVMFFFFLFKKLKL